MAKIGKKYLSAHGLEQVVSKIKEKHVRTTDDTVKFNDITTALTGYTLSTDIASKAKSPVIIGVASTGNSESIVKQSTVIIGGETLSVKETKDADGKVIKREYSKDILVTEKAVADLFEDLSEKIAAEGAVMDFKGTTDVTITNGSDVKPKDIYGDPDILGDDYKGPENGDVIVYNDEEFVWNNGAWHEIGQVFNSEAIQNINGTLAIKVEDTKDEDDNVIVGSKTIKLIINDTHVTDEYGNITDWYAADTTNGYGHIHLTQETISDTDNGLKAEYGFEVMNISDTVTGPEIDTIFNGGSIE